MNQALILNVKLLKQANLKSLLADFRNLRQNQVASATLGKSGRPRKVIEIETKDNLKD